MWFFRKKNRTRRLEIRKNLSASEVPAWRRFRDAGGVNALVLATLLYTGALLLDLWPADPMLYRENQYLTRDVYSRVNFLFLSETNVLKEQQRIKDSTPAIFTPVPDSTADKFLATLRDFPATFKSTTQPAALPESLAEQWALNDNAVATWQKYNDGRPREEFLRRVDALQKKLLRTPVVSHKQYADQQTRTTATEVELLRDDHATLIKKIELLDAENLQQVSTEANTLAAAFDPAIRAGVAKQLQVLLSQPNYVFSDLTDKRIDTLIAKLATDPPPSVYDAYDKGKLLLPQGKRLTPDDLKLLSAEHENYLAAQRQAQPWEPLYGSLGRAGVVLLICALLFIYVTRNDWTLIRNTWQATATILLLLTVLGINKAIMFSLWNERVAVLTIMMTGVILTIAFNQRLALAVTFVLALLTVYQLRGDMSRFIVLLTAAASIVLQLHEIRSRTKLIEAGAVSAGAVFGAVVAVGASMGLPWRVTMENAVWAAGAALLVGFLAQGVLPLVERTFKVATSMTLLEWCDASKPLLRRLAMEAPGTFNHCLQLGAMCEAAAEAIGARGLLARAGAYYHDIGKINKPEYFVENQAGMANPHAKLSPAMSLLIIIGHVKDGLEMAKEYGLPTVLREFIVSHHGTTLVQYFYHAATEQRKADAERAPDEVEFRYPGPKPHSKEAAILMLADAAESSVRAMPDPTPGRIENQVHIMVTRRLMDGQLDECNLTLRQVHQIEGSLVRSLCGVYHSRIAYPKLTGQKPAPAEQPKRNGKSNGRDEKRAPLDDGGM